MSNSLCWSQTLFDFACVMAHIIENEYELIENVASTFSKCKGNGRIVYINYSTRTCTFSMEYIVHVVNMMHSTGFNRSFNLSIHEQHKAHSFYRIYLKANRIRPKLIWHLL